MADVHYTGDKDEATSKATFETLLAKWDEIFQREEFFGDDAEWSKADGIDRVSTAGGKTLEFGVKSARKVKGDASGMISGMMASAIGGLLYGTNENTMSFAYSSAGKTLELAIRSVLQTPTKGNLGEVFCLGEVFWIFPSDSSVEVSFSINGEKSSGAQSELATMYDFVKKDLAFFIKKLTEAKQKKEKREADAKNAELEAHKAALYDALGDL